MPAKFSLRTELAPNVKTRTRKSELLVSALADDFDSDVEMIALFRLAVLSRMRREICRGLWLQCSIAQPLLLAKGSKSDPAMAHAFLAGAANEKEACGF